MLSFALRNRAALAAAREIELLRETVATMILRTELQKRSASEQPAGRGSCRDRSPEVKRQSDIAEAGLGNAGDRQPADRRTRILLISDYEGLRYSRELLLGKQGYDVHSVTSGEFLAAPDSFRCDVVILCQSLESDRALLVSLVLRRAQPTPALMRVYPFRIGCEPVFDLGVDGFDGPAVLLDVLQTYVHAHSHAA